MGIKAFSNKETILLQFRILFFLADMGTGQPAAAPSSTMRSHRRSRTLFMEKLTTLAPAAGVIFDKSFPFELIQRLPYRGPAYPETWPRTGPSRQVLARPKLTYDEGRF